MASDGRAFNFSWGTVCEFYVNGRRYEGSSESSGSELDKNEQVICHDPEDPSKNCSLWYLEKQTTGFWG